MKTFTVLKTTTAYIEVEAETQAKAMEEASSIASLSLGSEHTDYEIVCPVCLNYFENPDSNQCADH